MMPVGLHELKRPLVAILRGIRPEEAGETARELAAAGFEAIEVPLNSPDPFRSIGIIRAAVPDVPLIGAGTVLDVAAVGELAAAGGNLMVSPNVDVAVIQAAEASGMTALPGVFSPSEALLALKDYNSAIEINGEDPDLYYNRAIIYQALGRDKEAKDDF